MSVKTYSGGCLCGAIRFEAKAPAARPHTCSCRMCQRHTGGLTLAWVEFPLDADSSRAFCKTCGTSLGAIDDKPVVGLLLGVFDKPAAALRPTAHSFRSTRPKWWHVETDIA